MDAALDNISPHLFTEKMIFALDESDHQLTKTWPARDTRTNGRKWPKQRKLLEKKPKRRRIHLGRVRKKTIKLRSQSPEAVLPGITITRATMAGLDHRLEIPKTIKDLETADVAAVLGMNPADTVGRMAGKAEGEAALSRQGKDAEESSIALLIVAHEFRCSPKIQRPMSQTITTIFGKEPICSDNESPHSEVAKKMQANKDPSIPVELYTPDSAVKPQSIKQQAIPNECEDTAAVDGYFEKNTGVEEKPTETDTTNLCEGFFSSVSKLRNIPIPALNFFPDQNPLDPIHKVIEVKINVPEPAKQVENICVVSAGEQKDLSVQVETTPVLDSTANAQIDEKPEPVKECKINASKNTEQKEIINEMACESIMQDSKLSDMVVAHDLTVNETIDETVPMELEYDIYDDLDRSDAPSFSKNIGSTIIEAPKVKNEGESPKKTDENDEGIQIIEDIRLPEIADIENIAFTVDKNLQDSERPKTDKIENSNEDIQKHERKESSYSKDEASVKSSILYAQPDSTKIDHNDDAILENAMNELTGEQVPPGNHNTKYLNLSLEEDAIEMALEQLHQSSPDETAVTSTSNKAQQTSKDLIAILAQSPLHATPLKAKSPVKSPETEKPDKTPLKKRRVNLSENMDKSPSQETPVEETSGSLSCIDDSSTVTKRFSMGHTDYQFEQIKDEIVLRVKRRSRRKDRAPVEPKSIPSDGKSV